MRQKERLRQQRRRHLRVPDRLVHGGDAGTQRLRHIVHRLALAQTRERLVGLLLLDGGSALVENFLLHVGTHFRKRLGRCRHVLVDVDDHRMVVAQIDQTRIVTLHQHVVAERRGDYLRVGGHTLAALARKQRRGLDRQLQCDRGRLQRCRILVGVVGHLARDFVVRAVAFSRRRFLDQLVAHFLERLGFPAADIAQPDDVITIGRQYRLGYLTLLHREQRRIEGLVGHAFLQPAQIAAQAAGAQILRVLFGQFGEVAGIGFRRDLLGLGQSRLLLFRRGVGRHVDQDMRNEPLFRLHEALLLARVALPQLVVARLGSQRQIGANDLDVLHRDLLGIHVVGLVRLVPGFDLGIADRLVVQRGTRQLEVAQVAALAEQLQEMIELCVAGDGAVVDRRWQQLDGQ